MNIFFQSLLLLAHLIRNGSERVVTSAREHLYDLRSLESFHFVGKCLGLVFPICPFLFLFHLVQYIEKQHAYV